MAMDKRLEMSRRGFFQAVGTTGLVVATGGMMLPGSARAEGDVNAIIAKEMGAGAITAGKVNLTADEKQENGALVRIPVTVDHPMEAGNFVQSVGIFVDKNPNPFVAKFDYAAAAGVVGFELRIKMSAASPVRVVAKSSKGELFGAHKEIQVTAGGCAGG